MIVVIPTLWVFAFGTLLKPIGLGREGNSLPAMLAFSLVTAVVSGIVGYIFPLIFKKYYNPRKWTKGKFWSVYLSIITIITPVVYVMSECIRSDIGFISAYTPVGRFFAWYALVAFVGLFPVVVIYFSARHRSMEEKLQEVTIREASPTSEEKAKDTIILSGNTKSAVSLSPHDILYGEVQRNYVSVFYKKNDKIERKLLRITLTQIMESLQDYPQIIRCHRAFIVNMHNVTCIEGNSKSCYLKFKNPDIEVPVSRSYFDSVKQMFDN